MPTFTDRLKHSWNAFFNKDPTYPYSSASYGSSFRPDRRRSFNRNDRSVVTTVYNRIALDIAQVSIEHVKVDEDGHYLETIRSGLNDCLTLEANLDQSSHAFMIDLIMSMFDEGVVAVVPVDTTLNPKKSGGYDINTFRCGKVTQWFPDSVTVDLYNEKTGRNEEIRLPKKMVAIIENPLYYVMNEPNSTAQRLIRRLNLLDYVDEQSGSGKLDLIIQLPYVIKSQARRDDAEKRRKEIEMQLSGSKYGIAYTDGTEHITQLNRSVENNIWAEVKDLTAMLYNQLGLTESIFDGTADEKTMLNYYNRTIDPILTAIQKEFQRKFLTKTARTRGQAIRYYRPPFRLVPVIELADIVDKFRRNEIMSSNEIRTEMGMKPVNDPKADELINPNINHEEGTDPISTNSKKKVSDNDGGKNQNGRKI